MKTERANFERRILDALVNNLISNDYWMLCSIFNHNPGDPFRIKDILVYYLTKPYLSEFQLYNLCDLTDYMEHHCDKYLTDCYFEACAIICKNNEGNENYYDNLNEFTLDKLKSLIKIHFEN
jgi:hypothetical protein